MTLLALSGPSGICLAECRCSQYRNAVASACLCSIETGRRYRVTVLTAMQLHLFSPHPHLTQRSTQARR